MPACLGECQLSPVGVTQSRGVFAESALVQV
jgi:hypothetical protein